MIYKNYFLDTIHYKMLSHPFVYAL